MHARYVGLVAMLLVAAGCLSAPSEEDPTDKEPTDPAVPDTVAGTPVAALAWENATAGPTPRTEVVVGQIGSRFFVIGGFTADGNTPVAEQLVEIYDAATDRWSRGPDYPLQVHHSAAVEHEGSLYVLGGLITASFQPTALSFRYDTALDLWLPIAPMPIPRGSHAAAVIDGRLYVAAGTTTGGHTDLVHRYDPSANQWSQVGQPIPTMRDHTAGAAIDGRFYVAAGDVRGHGVNTNATESFDPATGTWTTHAPVPTLRGSVSALAWRDHLLLFGGQNGTQTFATVEAYDPVNDTWIPLPDLWEPRHGFGSGVWDDAPYVLYGGPRPGLSLTASVERLAVLAT